MIASDSAGSGAAASPDQPTPTVTPYPGSYPQPGGLQRPPGQFPPQPATPPPTDPAANTSTNVITLVCRAISLTSIDPSANRDIAYAVQDEIKASPLVDPKATSVDGNIVPDDATGTFTFTVKVAPLNPLTF